MGKLKDIIKENSVSGVVSGVANTILDAAKHFIPTEEGRREFELKVREIELEGSKAEYEDLADARKNETARSNSAYSGFLDKNIHEIIALIVVLSFVGLIIASVYVTVPAMAITTIKEAVMMVLAYLYGRSIPQQGKKN